MNFTESEEIYEYAASILCTCTKQENCRKRRLVSRIVKFLIKLLSSERSITKYYAISASGNVFFNNLCENRDHIIQLMSKFFAVGFTVKDVTTTRGLALALAMLSKEDHVPFCCLFILFFNFSFKKY